MISQNLANPWGNTNDKSIPQRKFKTDQGRVVGFPNSMTARPKVKKAPKGNTALGLPRPWGSKSYIFQGAANYGYQGSGAYSPPPGEFPLGPVLPRYPQRSY